jgi:hypothetical protein
VTETITAAATGDEPITVELQHADFGFGPDYQVQLIRDDAPETTAFSTRGWFSVPREQYRIAAGASVDIPLSIDVPDNTPGGTYLGAALLRVVPPDVKGGGSQVQAVPETGPLVFISVDGGEPPEAALRRFDLPSFASGGPIRPRVEIENLGDEFFTFEGTVRLRGNGKTDTARIERQFVVPGDPRAVRESPNRDDELELGSSKLGFGRYEVTTRLRIEPVGTSLVATRTIWVVPTWMRVLAALAALTLLACLALIARWVLQRRRIDEPPVEDEELLDDLDEDSSDEFS